MIYFDQNVSRSLPDTLTACSASFDMGDIPFHRTPSRISDSRSQNTTDEEPLYMASKINWKSRGSLSPIINETMQVNSEEANIGPVARSMESREKLAWLIINRELCEWERVCRTGRPSWYSPISRWPVVRSRPAEHQTPFGGSKDQLVGEDKQLAQTYDEKRRALSESYGAREDNVQDFAHLIAVQLLSSCFTLSPENLAAHKSSAQYCFDTLGSNDMPDSRLISSLRMHMDNRYYPAFGFEAPNTSPVNLWQGIYDGSNLMATVPSDSPEQQTAEIRRSGKSSHRRRRRARNPLDGTEKSTVTDSPVDSHEPLTRIEMSYPPLETVLRPRKNPRQRQRRLSLSSSAIKEMNGYLPFTKDVPLADRHRFPHPSLDDMAEDSYLPQQTRHFETTKKFSARTVSHSESHADSVHPMKDVVLKHWHTFKRRFVHNRNPNSQGRHRKFASSPISIQSSLPGSPVLSSDGRERRRQARQRHDIHSSSGESSPQYNSPMSTSISAVASPSGMLTPSSTPMNNTTYHLAAAATIAGLQIISGWDARSASGSQISTITPPNSLASPELSCGIGSKTESGFFSTSNSGKAKTISNIPSFTPRYGNRRQQRKSMLSEVCTPEDFEEPEQQKNSKEESRADKNDKDTHSSQTTISTNPVLNQSVHLATLPGNKGWNPDPTIGHMETLVRDQMAESEFHTHITLTGRQRLSRMSSSGTQIFTPHEDGVGVDGLPVGPSVDTWKSTGDRRERSFL